MVVGHEEEQQQQEQGLASSSQASQTFSLKEQQPARGSAPLDWFFKGVFHVHVDLSNVDVAPNAK